MKRKLFVLGLILAVLTLLGAGTAAYYTVTSQAHNQVGTGNLSFQLHEVGQTGTAVILPGDTVDKTVTVENVGSHPMYLRVSLNVRVADESLPADGCVTVNINTEDWTYRDGYYYYNYALEPGATSQALFTQVFIDGVKVDNSYLGKQFRLDVGVSAVQSEHNGATPFDAQGWPVPQGGAGE